MPAPVQEQHEWHATVANQPGGARLRGRPRRL